MDTELFEADDNYVWRRVVTNFVFMFCLVKQRDSLPSKGFYGKIGMNNSDVKLILNLMMDLLHC